MKSRMSRSKAPMLPSTPEGAMYRTPARVVVLTAVVALLWLGASPRAVLGWGCDGHQIVALIAQEHLQGSAAAAGASRLLSDHPIDPGLSRFCAAARLGAFVDAATWADDFRDQHPETGEWHFLDVPRGETKANAGKHC